MYQENIDFVILRHLMFEAIVKRLDNSSGKFKCYNLDISSNSVILNKKRYDWDLKTVNSTSFHIIKDRKTFSVQILEMDQNSRTVIVNVNNNRYQVSLRTKLDLLLQDMGMHQHGGPKIDQLRAPMPGLILEIMVNKGDEVKKGDSLLILEAMKMENVIRAPGDGKIKDIKVSQSEGVERNQVLIQF